MTDPTVDNALLAAWETTRERLADRPAIMHPSGSTLRTFQEIEAEAGTLAERLAAFPRRSVVAVQIGNSASWPALLLALFRAQLIPLPLGRHMEAAELNLALVTCSVAGLVTADADLLEIQNVELHSENSPWPNPAPDFLKLTSGTTSMPRAVRFRAHQLLADCDSICDTMGITSDDVNFGVIPFSHSYGFSNLVTPLIARGVRLVASEDRMPRAILNDLASSGATVFPGMPVFFQKFVDLDPIPALPQLRLCISAGAPLLKPLAERFSEKFGLRIHTFYGASECGGIGYDARDTGEHAVSFAGTAMRGVEITRAAGAEPGPIEVRSAAVADGYFPDAEDETLGGGRFVPSDLVRWKGAGMFIEGRASEVINVAGRKLNPLEVEQRLLECAGVKQAVVFGVPSALRGEEPVACVTAEAGADAAKILRFAHERLSPWQVPKDIWLVSEIPSNERGKISRRVLAEQYLALLASRVVSV